jgi:hypothetical protein
VSVCVCFVVILYPQPAFDPLNLLYKLNSLSYMCACNEVDFASQLHTVLVTLLSLIVMTCFSHKGK